MKSVATLLLIIFCVALLPTAPAAGDVRGQRGVVATVHPAATEAAIKVLKDGGNAVDAAVAAALMLGVVDGYNSGIGGGCFILIRQPNGKILAIDGRETAPGRATRDMYVRDGEARPDLSQTGPLASGTPGALAAYADAVSRAGRRSLKELLLPAAKVAEEGFLVDRAYAARLAATADDLARFEGSRAVLLKPNGEPYQQGDLLRQPDLGHTYRAIADEGTDWFYQGPLAKTVGEWMQANGGILTAEDFSSYRTVRREPVITEYRGHRIVGFPPPSSGGVHVAQILNILEQFDLSSTYKRDPAEVWHITAEAMKLSFADRAYWLGDPQFANVPRGLVDKAYAAQLARRIDTNRASVVARHDMPPRNKTDHYDKHTTHIAAADGEGNWVAITATINTTFGSKVIVPGTGVLLNNEMDDFSIQPGVPNAFGLVGAEANAIEPGKRPLSSMSPTIVLKEGRPVMTLGAAGGPKIISQVVLAIVNRIDLGMSLQEAVAAPRLHHQWSPDVVLVENGFPENLTATLREKGHKVESSDSAGVTQAVAVSDDGKSLIGVHDPRVRGKAMTFEADMTRAF